MKDIKILIVVESEDKDLQKAISDILEYENERVGRLIKDILLEYHETPE